MAECEPTPELAPDRIAYTIPEAVQEDSVVEQALAHSVGDWTVRAYRRRDALEKRRALMTDWAGYCLATVSAGVRIYPSRRR